MASAECELITGVWGQSPQLDVKPPEAEKFSALKCPKAATFLPFLGVLGILQ